MSTPNYEKNEIVCVNSTNLYDNELWPAKVVSVNVAEDGKIVYVVKLYYWNSVITVEGEEKLSPIEHGLSAVINTECPALVRAMQLMRSDPTGHYQLNKKIKKNPTSPKPKGWFQWLW